MRIKIISDGTTAGTNVIDLIRGARVDARISAARWYADANKGLCDLTLDIVLVPINVEGEASVGEVRCGHCGHKLEIPRLLKNLLKGVE